MIFKSPEEKQKLLNEYQCLKSISHPNVIEVYEYIPYFKQNCGFYVMEFCISIYIRFRMIMNYLTEYDSKDNDY